MIGLGVIGYGYWGPNLARNFAGTSGVKLVAIADGDAARREVAGAQHPGARVHADAAALVADPAVDAVAVATPAATHGVLALAALEAGKHVWVEKPMAASAAEAQRLIEAAARRARVLMVDHVYVHNAAAQRIRGMIDEGALGTPYYYDAVRINLGRFQPDVSVLWDLAAHDLALVDYLFEDRPVEVSAIGAAHMRGAPENIAYVTLRYDAPLIAHIHVNWLAPVKTRRTTIGGSRRMAVWNDLIPDEKLKVYDCGVDMPREADERYQRQVGYRQGDVWSPRLDVAEPLARAAAHFVDCIAGGRTPLTDGASGLRVVRLLEAAAESMARDGRPVALRSKVGA